MRDDERLALFAKLLELPIAKFRELVIARGLVDRSTLDRIRGGRRKDKGHAKKTGAFTKLVKFIDPEYLARPSIPNDPFIASPVARRLRGVDGAAFVLWGAFLKGERDVVPDWDKIEEHWLMSSAYGPQKPGDRAVARQGNGTNSSSG